MYTVNGVVWRKQCSIHLHTLTNTKQLTCLALYGCRTSCACYKHGLGSFSRSLPFSRPAESLHTYLHTHMDSSCGLRFLGTSLSLSLRLSVMGRIEVNIYICVCLCLSLSLSLSLSEADHWKTPVNLSHVTIYRIQSLF